MDKKTFLLLFFVLFIATFLRFWQLGNYPASLSFDEIAIGYDAFSVLKTAQDQHGQLLPVFFRSVGDFKLPFLIYLTVPSLAVFGLNEFAVRFIIAFFGTLTVLLVYFFIKELTNKKEIAFLASFSLAISPWHIHFSRATFEAILALFLMILGMWLFLRELRLKKNRFWLALTPLVLAMYTYHSERMMIPLLFLAVFLIYRQKLLPLKKEFFRGLLIGGLLLLPLLICTFQPGGLKRTGDVFLTHDYEFLSDLSSLGSELGLAAKVLANQPLMIFNLWLKRYFGYWDFNFFFTNGLQFTLVGCPDVGLLHFFEMISAMIGLWLLACKRLYLHPAAKKLMIAWLLLGPLSASLANNPLHPLRSLSLIPMPQLLSALGLFWLWEKAKVRFFPKLAFIFLLVVLATTGVIYFLDIYFVHFPVHYGEFWGGGMKEVSLYLWEHHDEYQEVVIDPRFGSEPPIKVGLPHLYLLFYGQYDPYLFQNSPRRLEKTENSVNFANFTFREIYWPEDKDKKKTLFVGSAWSLPLEDLPPGQIKKEIKFSNGRLGYLIVSSKND